MAGGMATLRLFRTACACLTMCPFVMCGGDGRVLTRVSALAFPSRILLFIFIFIFIYLSSVSLYSLCGVKCMHPRGQVG